MNTSHSQHQFAFRIFLTITFIFLSFNWEVGFAQTRRMTARSAIVVDERLAALRSAPHLSAPLLKRISRGRSVTIVETQRSREGVVFHRVAVTRRTSGWIQREALILPRRPGEDARLVRLIKASRDFDRIARSRIFLDAFPHSSLRPAVLLILGEEANKAARKLSQDAARRLEIDEIAGTGATIASYFLNYSGLDRYRRQGIVFTFDPMTRQFHYDGWAWRELVRRHSRSAEAAIVREKQ